MHQAVTHDHAPHRALAADHAASSPTHLVLNDDLLSDAEKRDILASWASDRRAVVDRPSLRLLDDGTILCVDDILAALKSLDRATVRVTPSAALIGLRALVQRRPPASARGVMRVNRRRPNDDDDPPPCPAGSARPFGPRPMGGTAGVVMEDMLAVA